MTASVPGKRPLVAESDLQREKLALEARHVVVPAPAKAEPEPVKPEAKKES